MGIEDTSVMLCEAMGPQEMGRGKGGYKRGGRKQKGYHRNSESLDEKSEQIGRAEVNSIRTCKKWAIGFVTAV